MGNLNKIVVDPFKGDVIDMLQKICNELEAGKTYNPLGVEKIEAKKKELEAAIWALDESRVLDKE